MKISVTQEHIGNGVPGSCDFCPIALAIVSTLGYRPHGLEVSGNYIEMEGERPRATSAAMKEFIDAFDDGLPVQPFEFELVVPDAD